MENFAGETLSSVIAGKGLPLQTALGYAVRIADAMASVHAAGILHGDLKPANVVITQDGGVRILHFGPPKLIEPALPVSENGKIVGTLIYMSPEQLQAKPVDARSEVFSFGSVLFEMLTGWPPFAGETLLATVNAIVYQEPLSLSETIPDLPSELEHLVLRCLSKDPQDRWQAMSDLRVALEDLRTESRTRLER